MKFEVIVRSLPARHVGRDHGVRAPRRAPWLVSLEIEADSFEDAEEQVYDSLSDTVATIEKLLLDKWEVLELFEMDES